MAWKLHGRIVVRVRKSAPYGRLLNGPLVAVDGSIWITGRRLGGAELQPF